MSQKGLMRILSRKDGKDIVSDGKENEQAGAELGQAQP